MVISPNLAIFNTKIASYFYFQNITYLLKIPESLISVCIHALLVPLLKATVAEIFLHYKPRGSYYCPQYVTFHFLLGIKLLSAYFHAQPQVK